MDDLYVRLQKADELPFKIHVIEGMPEDEVLVISPRPPECEKGCSHRHAVLIKDVGRLTDTETTDGRT